jgi:hypothetical protein
MAQALGVEQVYATLQAAIRQGDPGRAAAEAQLKSWEQNSSPGFIGDLIKVALEAQAVPEVRIPRSLYAVTDAAQLATRAAPCDAFA